MPRAARDFHRARQVPPASTVHAATMGSRPVMRGQQRNRRSILPFDKQPLRRVAPPPVCVRQVPDQFRGRGARELRPTWPKITAPADSPNAAMFDPFAPIDLARARLRPRIADVPPSDDRSRRHTGAVRPGRKKDGMKPWIRPGKKFFPALDASGNKSRAPAASIHDGVPVQRATRRQKRDLCNPPPGRPRDKSSACIARYSGWSTRG